MIISAGTIDNPTELTGLPPVVQSKLSHYLTHLKGKPSVVYTLETRETDKGTIHILWGRAFRDDQSRNSYAKERHLLKGFCLIYKDITPQKGYLNGV
jgi:hypothetical protein